MSLIQYEEDAEEQDEYLEKDEEDNHENIDEYGDEYEDNVEMDEKEINYDFAYELIIHVQIFRARKSNRYEKDDLMTIKMIDDG